MFDEYDVVRATRQLSKNVPSGSTGTILIVHAEPSTAYEVEFMDGLDTLDILTVTDEDIELRIHTNE